MAFAPKRKDLLSGRSFVLSGGLAVFDGAVHKLGKEKYEERFDGKVEEPRKEEAQCAFETERLLRRQGDLLFLRAVLFGGLLPKGEGEEHDEREHELHDGDRKMPEKSAETMVEREMMRLMTPAEEREAPSSVCMTGQAEPRRESGSPREMNAR